MPPEPESYQVDEELLRQCVLRAYHEKRESGVKAKRTLSAIRQFLSGAPGGENVPGRYWFEQDPPASIASFVEDLEKVAAGLARTAFEPVLAQARKAAHEGQKELAPKLSVYLSSLGGAVAVKAKLDETLACGLVSAAIIGLARLGPELFEKALPPAEGEARRP